MLKGFWKLSWVETKIFLREPMGVIGSIGLPVLIFAILGRTVGTGRRGAGPGPPFNVPILAALMIAVGAVVSLVAIIAIYREGGILKRLRATPLSPVTILAAHVFLKLAFTTLSLGLMVLLGRRLFPGAISVGLPAFTAALLLGTLSILSLGFVIASVVPTARFAQPVTAAVLYPMVALSGLFFPIESLSTPLRIAAACFPTTHAVALMQGIWDGTGWDLSSTLALVAIFAACTAISARVFRWE